MAQDPLHRSASSRWSGSPGPAGIRIGDVEREQAVQSLGEHLRAGRLTMVEYDERLQQAFAARTEAELTPLFTDLPGGSPRSAPGAPPERSARRARRTMPVPIRLVVLLVLIAAATVATVVTLFPFLLVFAVLGLVMRHRLGGHRHYGPHRGYGPHRHYDARGYDFAGPRRY